MSNGINVTYRTPSWFTTLVTHNCSLINSFNLSVFYNGPQKIYCYITGPFSIGGTVEMTCYNIWNNTGRNWTFSLGPQYVHDKIILNQTFTITITPLSLHTNTYISITVHDNLTSASVVMSNCLEISDLQYLVFPCNDSDLSNRTLSNSCTYTCSDLEPGSIYNTSLVRLAIPIADKMQDKHDPFFEEETLNKVYRISMNKYDLSFPATDYHFRSR
jgi:hypothetical protein